MDLNDFFGPETPVIHLQGANRWQSIDELIQHLASLGRIKIEHQQAILTSVRKREYAMSTGIGYGIGIPHARTEFVDKVVMAVGCSRKGIQFDALDGKPVDLVFLFLVPEGEFQKHLNTLANIAKQLHRDDFRDALRRRFLGE